MVHFSVFQCEEQQTFRAGGSTAPGEARKQWGWLQAMRMMVSLGVACFTEKGCQVCPKSVTFTQEAAHVT